MFWKANLEEEKNHEYYQLCGNTIEWTKGRDGGAYVFRNKMAARETLSSYMLTK